MRKVLTERRLTLWTEVAEYFSETAEIGRMTSGSALMLGRSLSRGK